VTKNKLTAAAVRRIEMKLEFVDAHFLPPQKKLIAEQFFKHSQHISATDHLQIK